MKPFSVRIYSPFFPFPPQSGAAQVIYEQARRYAAQGNEVELVFWRDSAAAVTDKLSQPYFKPFEDRILLSWLPDPELRRLPVGQWRERAAQSRVALAPDERQARVLRSLFSDLASPELYHYPLEFAAREDLGKVDLAIYHYSFAYAWLKTNAPRAKEKHQVVQFHNLESELFALRASKAPFPERTIHKINEVKLARHERALARMGYELWFLSPADLRKMESLEPEASLKLVVPEFDPDLREHRRRRYREHGAGAHAAGFIGALDFAPNQDSLGWIIERVLPVMRQQGFRGKFLIAGRDLPEKLRQDAAAFEFVEYLGFVPDVEEFWSRISVLLSPHVSGSGTRIKLLEAVASGVSVMTNSRGAELLPASVRKSPLLRVSEDPEEWARTVIHSSRN